MSEATVAIPEDAKKPDDIGPTEEQLAAKEPTLHQKTMRGLGWSTFATMASAIMQIAYTAAVTRLVDPAAFGLVAASGTLLRFGGYFSEMGLGKATVQKADLTDNNIRAAVTGTVGLGLITFAVFFVLAPILAPLAMDDPALVWIIRVQALSFLFGGMNNVPLNILRRRMDFATIAKVELASYLLAYSTVGIGLAVIDKGLWGIALAGVTQQLLAAIMHYAVARHPILPIFKKDAFAPMLGYGSRISAISFVEFLGGTADTFVIGKRLGAMVLGLYSRAQMLVQLPIYNLTTTFSRVLFPAMSSIQKDRPRLRRVYLSSITLLAMIILPVGVGLSFASEEAILTVLGLRFASATGIFTLLAIMTPFRLLTYFSGLVCDSTGHLNAKLATELAFVVLYAVAFWLIALPYGVEGIAQVLLVGEVVHFFIYAVILGRLLEFSVWSLAQGFVPVLLTSLTVAGTVWAAGVILPGAALPALGLLAKGLAGAVGFGIGLLAPWSRGIRAQLYERFLANSQFSQHRLVLALIKL